MGSPSGEDLLEVGAEELAGKGCWPATSTGWSPTAAAAGFPPVTAAAVLPKPIPGDPPSPIGKSGWAWVGTLDPVDPPAP